MKHRIAMVAVALVMVLTGRSSGQNYRFAIPEADITVTLGQDGSATIDYALTFECARGAHAIDVVDIGMPNQGRHAPISAHIDGHEIPRGSIAISTFLKPHGCGYEVQLGRRAIRPGRKGVFRFRAREAGMVWQDSGNRDQASFRFTPTWFGSQYVSGSTELTLRYRLPIPASDYAAVKDRILWQKRGQDFSAKGVMEDEAMVSVAWVRRVTLTGRNMFAVSFPRQYVPKVRKITIWHIFYKWFSQDPEVMAVSGLAVVVAFSALFFWITHFTGWPLYFILLVLGIVGMTKSPGFHLALYPALSGAAVLYGVIRHRRKKRYFPAQICREGGGLKRGLTAVEAAVLLELPLPQVLTMVVFGLVKKGLLHVVTRDPLRVEVRGKERSKLIWVTEPGAVKVKIRNYEAAFLKIFEDQARARVDSLDLSKPVKRLIMGTADAMRQFDLDLTRAYYRGIVSRAWLQVEREADYEARYKKVDETWDWLTLDGDWGQRLDEVGRGGRAYSPRWYRGHGGGTRMTPSRGAASAPKPSVSPPDVSFSDLTNSIAGQLEGASTRAVRSLDGLVATGRGGVDLSSVDRITAKMLASMASSGGSGGGFSGGGCACACAGCACACACAGGGR